MVLVSQPPGHDPPGTVTGRAGQEQLETGDGGKKDSWGEERLGLRGGVGDGERERERWGERR
jgi:hypothetical protein